MTSSSLQELINLFASLASHLQTLTLNHHSANPQLNPHHHQQEHQEQSLTTSISNLNKTLNLNQQCNNDPALTFLDTALSLMCFKSHDVFGSMIECQAKTIISALLSSINCNVIRFQKEEALRIGSSIMGCDSVEVFEACCNVLEKLEGNDDSGKLSTSLIDAVLRTAVSSSCYQHLFPSVPVLDVQSADLRSKAVFRPLLKYLPRGSSMVEHGIPLRLLYWYLDPLTLKDDILGILQETIKRPFLPLIKEFHERIEWRMIIISLVLSPIMFLETRAMLHKWFLETGLTIVLEFTSGLVLVILDVIARPTWWGLSIETGLKMPFSYAYFPFKHHFLKILNGPITSASFLQLVHFITEETTSKRSVMKLTMVDYKSTWSLAITFPSWFYFSSILLFFDKCCLEDLMVGQSCYLEEAKNTNQMSCLDAAARYIAWILSPFSKVHQELTANCLTEISEAWNSRWPALSAQDKEMSSYRKKFKKLDFSERKNEDRQEERDNESIALLLEDIQSMCGRYSTQVVNSPGPSALQFRNVLDLQHNIIFRRISLGILIGCSSDLKEGECERILHFASVGRVLPSRTKSARTEHLRSNSGGLQESTSWINEYNKEEVVASACLVLNLAGIVQDLSASLYETEGSRINFVCRFKERAGGYLAKCVRRLIQLKMCEDGSSSMLDLYHRLLQWKHPEKGICNIPKELDDVIYDLSYKISAQ